MADFVGDDTEPPIYEDGTDGSDSESYSLAHEDEYVDRKFDYWVSPTPDDEYDDGGYYVMTKTMKLVILWVLLMVMIMKMMVIG